MKKIHPAIKAALGVSTNNEKLIIRDWKKKTRRRCKPCWELKYCPYGPLVEEFPLLPQLRDASERHFEYLRSCLITGVMANGTRLDAKRRALFKKMLLESDLKSYPKSIPSAISEAACRVYGHMCPVFFVAESLTETKDRRKQSRNISREIMLRVVRRDGQICRKCGKPVSDNEVEFDHIIPFSKGGPSTVENLRLIHRNCNRTKSASLDEILDPSPIEHLFELRKNKKKGTRKVKK